jgi:uncharacterized membrane protein
MRFSMRIGFSVSGPDMSFSENGRREQMNRGIFFVALCVTFAGAAMAPGQSYTVTDLGSLSPTGININGEVCGNIPGPGGTTHAATYSSGDIQDLGVLPGYTSSFANDLNASGEVVGYQMVPAINNPFTQDFAFFYSNGTMVDMTTLPTFNTGGASIARAINTAGVIVGQATVNDTFGFLTGLGFVYSNGTINPSPLNFIFINIGGEYGGDTFAVNDSGEVAGVGYSDYNLGHRAAAFFSAGQVTSVFGSVHGAIPSSCTAINSSGQVLGQVFSSDINGTNNPGYSFVDSNGNVQQLTLNASQCADGLNDAGDIVGSIGNDAALYDGQTTSDLNSLISASSGWTLEDATAINDDGQIVGVGVNPGGQTDGLPHRHRLLIAP